MKTIIKYFVFLSILLIAQTIYAQQNNTLFYMKNVPEASIINPAFQMDYKIFVGLPALSSIHANYGNIVFDYNRLINFGTGLYRD